MTTKNIPILECGNKIIVKSSKVSTLRDNADDFIKNATAKYTFTGINEQSFSIDGEKVDVIQSDNDNSFYANIPGGAVFFDQTDYMVYIKLLKAKSAYLFSPINAWCDKADWDNETKCL
jgi:hypothetical protein